MATLSLFPGNPFMSLFCVTSHSDNVMSYLYKSVVFLSKTDISNDNYFCKLGKPSEIQGKCQGQLVMSILIFIR
jgi:hypothetical protein